MAEESKEKSSSSSSSSSSSGGGSKKGSSGGGSTMKNVGCGCLLCVLLFASFIFGTLYGRAIFPWLFDKAHEGVDVISEKAHKGIEKADESIEKNSE